MARYELTRKNPEDENYLEGLRYADRRRQEDVIASNVDIGVEHADHLEATSRNWDQITPKSTEPEEMSFVDRILGVSRPIKRVPNESEFLPGMSTQEMHPIKHDEYHVSKQLVEHVNKLSTLSARRQPTDYHVEVGGRGDISSASLIHTPTGQEVGSVDWKEDGYVNNLSVNLGHRHMTNYLVTQAWNNSRTKGEAGPASSDLLSPFSEKIVRKYNPNSEGFRTFEINKSAQCGSCRGEGELRLQAVPHNDGTHVRYVDSHNEVQDIVENNAVKRGYFLRTAAHRYNVTWQGGGQGIHNPQTGDSHWWHDYQITCPRCAGSGERQIDE